MNVHFSSGEIQTTHKCMNQTETSGKCQENANQNHTEAASHLCTTIIFLKKSENNKLWRKRYSHCW